MNYINVYIYRDCISDVYVAKYDGEHEGIKGGFITDHETLDGLYDMVAESFSMAFKLAKVPPIQFRLVSKKEWDLI